MNCAVVALLPAFLLLASWEWAAHLDSSTRFLLGTPTETAAIAFSKITDVQAWNDFWITGSAALSGLALGACAGTLTGLFLALSPRMQKIIYIYVLIIASVPVLAIAPLMILWFGIGWGAKVWIAALGSAIACMQASRSGALAATNEFEEYLKSVGPSRWSVICHVLLPGAMLWVINGARQSIGIAILGVFIGECLNSQAGVGHMIVRASGLYHVSEVWCGVLMLATIAILLDAGIRLMARRFWGLTF